MAKTAPAAKGMQYSKDKFGKEILLKNGSLQVEMEWEKPYLEACIDALKPSGDVLEVGFGLGYAANRIQHYHPKSHTIIESDPVILEMAKNWAKEHKNVKIIKGSWQEIMPQLGNFDALFFDDYVPLSESEIEQLKQDTAKYRQIAAEANNLKEMMAQTLKQFKGITFSDQELQQFARDVLRKPNVTFDQVVDFVSSLVQRGHITVKQKEAFIKNLQLAKKSQPAQRSPVNLLTDSINSKQFGYRFYSFAELSLNQHMHAGSRLSGYIGQPDANTQFKEFENKILSRKDVQHKSQTLPVTVPPNCDFFHGNKALILVIEKK